MPLLTVVFVAALLRGLNPRRRNRRRRFRRRPFRRSVHPRRVLRRDARRRDAAEEVLRRRRAEIEERSVLGRPGGLVIQGPRRAPDLGSGPSTSGARLMDAPPHARLPSPTPAVEPRLTFGPPAGTTPDVAGEGTSSVPLPTALLRRPCPVHGLGPCPPRSRSPPSPERLGSEGGDEDPEEEPVISIPSPTLPVASPTPPLSPDFDVITGMEGVTGSRGGRSEEAGPSAPPAPSPHTPNGGRLLRRHAHLAGTPPLRPGREPGAWTPTVRRLLPNGPVLHQTSGEGPSRR